MLRRTDRNGAFSGKMTVCGVNGSMGKGNFSVDMGMF
jgi:hypothetical protein